MKPKYLIYQQNMVDTILQINSGYFDRQEAITRFIAYLNHPNDLASANLAASVYDAIFKSLYAIKNRDRSDSPTFDLMKYHQTVLQALRGVYGVDFTTTNLMHFDDAVPEKFFAADLVRFLVAYGFSEKSSTHRPSIKKAHFYFQKFPQTERDWDYSWKRYNELWTKYKTTSHYLYTDLFEFNGMFDIPINDDNFFEKIEILIKNPSLIFDFFQKSKFVFEYLTKTLDKRAVKLLRFPKLAKGLAPVVIKIPELSAEERELMTYYTSTHDIG